MKSKHSKTSFSASLDSLEAKFYSLNLDERFAFIEWFKLFIAELKDEFKKSILSQLANYLEKQMNKSLENWLNEEMK